MGAPHMPQCDTPRSFRKVQAPHARSVWPAVAAAVAVVAAAAAADPAGVAALAAAAAVEAVKKAEAAASAATAAAAAAALATAAAAAEGVLAGGLVATKAPHISQRVDRKSLRKVHISHVHFV